MIFSNLWASKPFNLTRRQLMKAGLGGAGLMALGGVGMQAMATSMPASTIDRSDPMDNLRAWIKIYSDIAGHVDVYSHFRGEIFAALPGNVPLQTLLGFEGFAVNRVVPLADGTFNVFINEVAFYKDLETDRIIDTWLNPFTKEQVDVFQLHAGPLTAHLGTTQKFEQPDGSFVEKPFVLPWFVLGDDALLSIEFNDVRDNPLTPEEWPRESVGEKIRISETLQFMTSMSELEDPAVTRVNPMLSWTLLRSWLPWMLMGPRPGHLMYRNIVQKVGGIDDIPKHLIQETEKRFPEYLVSPPASTFGQFQTSYKVYKKERKPKPVL